VMNGLYKAQKDHSLGKVAELPAPDYPKNYNSLLQFVQNLYLGDLASISFYFLKARFPELQQYGLFRKALEEAAKNKMEQD